MKTIYWLIGIILSPILLVLGIVFFVIAAAIVISIAILVGLLSFLIYLNRKFKYMIYRVRNKQNKEEAPKKHQWKGEEVIIEQIEEREKNDKK